MTLRRTLATTSASLLLLASLTACFGIPTGGTGTGTGTDTDTADLTGTTWSGTDSDGDTWNIEFQSDGTIGLTYDTNGPYDDATDTWDLEGTALSIHVEFDDGAVDMTGDYTGGDTIDLDGTYTGGTYTLTLTQD